MQSESTDNADVRTALQEAISRVQSFRVLYEKLLIGKDYQNISVKDYIESLIDALTSALLERENISIETKITDCNMNTKDIIAQRNM